MKKFVPGALLVSALFILSACGGNPSGGSTSGQSGSGQAGDTTKPVFSGIKQSLTCEAGKPFNLLEGVSAVDDVDGDLTSKISVSTMPELTVTNGVITPSKDDVGFFDVEYKVADAAGNEEVAYSELDITGGYHDKVLYKDYDFNIGTQGWSPDMHENVLGTHGIYHGKYVFDITKSDGTDWHVKYANYNYEVKAGHTYKLTAKFNSNKAGEVVIWAGGADSHKNAVVGDNTMIVTYEAKVDTLIAFELQFGKLAPNGEACRIELDSIDIDDTTQIIESAEPVEIQASGSLLADDWSFNKDPWHSEYTQGDTGVAADVTKTADYIAVKQTHAGQNWAGRLIVNSKAKALKDVTYTVTLTLEADHDCGGLEFGFGGWGDDFKKFYEAYGQTLTANTKKVVSFSFTPNADYNEPCFRLAMGAVAAGTTVKASEFSVTYELDTPGIDFTNEDFASIWTDPADRAVVDERTTTSITTKVITAVANPWEASTNLKIRNINLAAGKIYRVKLGLESSEAINNVNVMMGSDLSAWDPENLFVTSDKIALESNEERVITAVFTATANVKDAYMRIKYGTLPADAKFTVRDLTFELITYKEATATNIIPEGWSFISDNYCAYAADGSVRPEVTKDANHATFTSTGTSDVWEGKAIIETRTELNVGHRYHLALTLESSKAINKPAYELEIGAGKIDGDFKQIGHHYGVELAANTPTVYEFYYEADTHFDTSWGFGIWMGKVESGTALTVTNVVVEEVPAASESETTTFNFIPQGVGQFANEGTAESELYVEEGVLVYDIKKIDHTLDWGNKFFLTNFVLEGGNKYVFELVLKADSPITASLLLNVAGKWDVRAQEALEVGTEFTKYTLETPLMAADLTFELLFQDLHVNEVDHAKIEFQSIQIFSQAPLE